MIVALDATPLIEPTGGIARYTAELSRALAEEYCQDQYWLVSDQRFTWQGPDLPNLHRGDPPATARARRWWMWGLRSELSRIGAHVFHGTDFAVPYLPVCPSVITIHDLSPWRDTEWQPEASRIRQRTPLMMYFGLATMIVTPSEAIRREVLDRFKVEAGRVVATPLACSRQLRTSAQPHESRYFLFVGTMEPRKNLATLISAWREVYSRTGVGLVIAGRCRADFRPPRPEPGLRLLGAIPDEELASWYAGAAAFVYPSFYEGFGLPVLEAMAAGVPVITSTDPAITEVAAGAAIQLDPRDVRVWKEALLAVAASPEQAAALREKGLQRASEFSWTRTARRTREVYEEARRRYSA